MRYLYEKPKEYTCEHGIIYACNHPLYKRCTLFKDGYLGLAIVQERFDPHTKSRRWDTIDEWLNDDLYSNKGFREYFLNHASIPTRNGLYPTVTIRQIMWALKMKSLPKEYWEQRDFQSI